MYFIRNIETEKVELHFTKQEYKALPAEQSSWVKSNFRFSPSIPAWTSKRKLENFYDYASLTKFGFEDHGKTGERLTFAEKVEREQEKAEARAERMENRADKADAESTSRYEAAKEIGSYIPFGQPILVGHHSEGRHRAAIKKIDNNMRKSVEASEKASYYRDRLANAQHTAEGKKFKNAGYLVNRIKECETELRALDRYLQGKHYTYSEPRPISDERRAFLNERIAVEQDKLDYMTFCLKELSQEKTVWTKETLKEMKYAKVKGRWREIVRCNPTTVSVSNAVFDHDPALARKYALKYNYGEIQDAKATKEETL
jgi:hypothetical protein